MLRVGFMLYVIDHVPRERCHQEHPFFQVVECTSYAARWDISTEELAGVEPASKGYKGVAMKARSIAATDQLDILHDSPSPQTMQGSGYGVTVRDYRDRTSSVTSTKR